MVWKRKEKVSALPEIEVQCHNSGGSLENYGLTLK